MRVLQLCNKPPFPAVDGGCIAIKNISLGLLSADIDLKILTISTSKHPFDEKDYPDDFIKKTKIEGVFVDTRINVIDAFSALVTSDSYNVSRFFSTDFDMKLRQTLQKKKFDCIHLESLFMTPYLDTIRKFSKAKVVMRSHNLEHLIWERLANLEKKSAKRIYLKHLSKKLKKFEEKVLNEVDGIAAISFDDSIRYERLKCNVPLITIPFGIDLDQYPIEKKKKSNGIEFFHIGSMNWNPNVEGVNWFLDEIYPKVLSKDFKLHLAGREMPTYLSNMASKNLEVHGEVNSANEFINAYDVMVVPLLSGSGMRIKIIEAMALGKTVVTTRVGVEGIDAKHGENILVAKTAQEFVEIIKDLIANPKMVEKIGKNARKLVEKKYDNASIINKLTEFYQAI